MSARRLSNKAWDAREGERVKMIMGRMLACRNDNKGTIESFRKALAIFDENGIKSADYKTVYECARVTRDEKMMRLRTLKRSATR